MAKRVTGFEIDDDGRMHQYSGKQPRHQRKSESQLIPWTEGPTTRGKKIRRALWG